jgi:HEAT repeat protein
MNVTTGHSQKPTEVGWFRRWRVNRLLDMPEKDAAPKLARFGSSAFPVLMEALEKAGPKEDLRRAKAAYLIGKLAENGVDCTEAVMPLYGLLQAGGDIEKGNGAVALARIWTEESISKLVAALNDKNNISRRFAAVGLGMAGVENPLAMRALNKAAESDCDPEVRKLAQKALRQIAELQQ